MPGVERYDVVPYESWPYPGCHPDALAVVAQLAGVDVPDPSTWRVLDLGCADGGNLLAIAQSLPRSECVGIDANAASIERGLELSRASGLRVPLLQGDLTALPSELGTFDAIIVHGVWSWFGDDLRARLPGILAGLLAPRGIALVSYHALPGQLLLGPSRLIAGRRARAFTDAGDQVRAARESLKLALDLHAGAGDHVYARLLEAEAARWAERPDALVFHDLLGSDSSPSSVEDVAGAMSSAGLSWLGEARPAAWWPWRLDAAKGRRLREAAGDDPVARQQLFDDAQGAVFNVSLFVHGATGGPREPDAERALGLRAARALDGPSHEPRDATETQLLAALEPRPAPVPDVLARAGIDGPTGCEAVLRLAAADVLTLHRLPAAWVEQPGERPLASGLARAQAATGQKVSTLRHSVVTFNEDLGRALLLLLDGTRDRAAILDELAAMVQLDAAGRQALEDGLDGALDAIGRMALLVE